LSFFFAKKYPQFITLDNLGLFQKLICESYYYPFTDEAAQTFWFRLFEINPEQMERHFNKFVFS